MARMCAFLLAFSALTACADDTTNPGGHLGQNGANCLRTPDCAAPLQCIQNVCSSVAEADTSGGDSGDATAGTDGVSGSETTATQATTTGDTGDVNTVHETAVASETGADTAPDATATASDASGDTTATEVGIADTNFAGDCGDLGIASNWKGTFEGAIDYSVTPNPLTPSVGTLEVNGSLAFEITCVDSKFIVRGTLDGNAIVPGQFGIFPFQLTLQGHYNKVTQEMTTKMVDGSVSIYGLVHVFFEGDFPGELGADGDFHGTWSGYSTGTDSTLITGDATGDGTWDASPAP